MKKIITIIVIVALLAAAVLLLKQRRAQVAAAPTAAAPRYSVRVVTPQQREVSAAITFLAKLEGRDNISIASRLSSRVIRVAVRENQRVKRGDLLLTLDDSDITTALHAARAHLHAARTRLGSVSATLRRNQALYDGGGLAREQLDNSRAARDDAAAAVTEIEQNIANLRHQLSYCRISAPFSATVATLLCHPGDMAMPGKPLLTLLSDEQKLTFSFYPQRQPLRVGMAVSENGKPLGPIHVIYPQARNGLSVAEVLPTQRVAAADGSYLSVSVTTARQSGCAVPVTSLLQRQHGTSVMCYRDGAFVEQPVTVMVSDDSYAIISPSISAPVAVAAQTKLALLPGHGNISVTTVDSHD